MSSEGDGWEKLPGRLIVISGPSGSGKSTLVRRLLARPDLRLSVSISATTRQPRPGEVPGRDYVFLSPDEFERIRGDLLESAQVHDHFYGTPAEPVRRAMADGFCVILVIDVQGGFQVRQKVPQAPVGFRPASEPRDSGKPTASTRYRRRDHDSSGDWQTRGARSSWRRVMMST